ncbi:MAG TPA: methyltransferase domain-containing protein [Ktedonobacteraceae bacterium]|nr:methyltransferase domain-containing protein [Ktedonobacteraceae bacterium]
MTTPRYDQIADWYNESIRSGSLIHDLVVPNLLNLAGDIQGKHVCDLACGQGVISRQLAHMGASVVGVDIAEKMLEYARRDEEMEPLGIVYLHDDAQTVSSIADATFDGAVCNMSLMDVTDVSATFHTVRRILREGGWFAFSITHPCFQTPASTWMNAEDGTVYREVRGYFAEGFWRSDNARGVRGQVGAYHRMLSTYLNALAEAGFLLERMVEPQATGEIATSIPGYVEVPAAFVVRCKRI